MAEVSAARVVGIDLGTTNSLVAFMQAISRRSFPARTATGWCLRWWPSMPLKHGFVVGNGARATLLKDASSVVYSAKR